MSECVVRMEMPKHCYHCDLRYECDAFYAPGKRKPFDKGCRIVCQLPEGHGRLVDAEILRAKLIEHIAETNGFGNAFNETPTIVPAERSATCLD